MSKCSKCGRKIVNAYFLDGKPYGIECFKEEMKAKYDELNNKRLEQYILQCIATIEILKTKNLSKITNEWKLRFIKSILNQWDECRKLSKKQLDTIWDWFSKEEKLQYDLYQMHLTEDTKYKLEIANRIYTKFFDLGYYNEKKHSEVLKEILEIKHNNGYALIEWESGFKEYLDIKDLEAYTSKYNDMRILEKVML